MKHELIVIPAGVFQMGSDYFYAEERPVTSAEVSSFLMMKNPVTNGQFTEFIQATGYITSAELPIDKELQPGFPDEYYRAASLVFRPTGGPVPLTNPRQWWALVEGACWQAPEGPGSSISDRANHPVTHVSWRDAHAYAKWAGLRLPLETEWEWAASGGKSSRYPWGDEIDLSDPPANIWVGNFPYQHQRCDAAPYSTPVGQYAPNGFGLNDMIGNVWEWTSSPFDRRTNVESCCTPAVNRPEKTLTTKGGSFLCAEAYCQRYRRAARSPQNESASTSNIGFRCATDL